MPIEPGDIFTRPSAGGGGFGDPLERDPERVLRGRRRRLRLVERALKDYGVVVREVDADLSEYEVDAEATERERDRASPASAQGWLDGGRRGASPQRYRDGELDVLDLVRQLRRDPRLGHRRAASRSTTEKFRAMLRRRAVAHWQ